MVVDRKKWKIISRFIVISATIKLLESYVSLCSHDNPNENINVFCCCLFDYGLLFTLKPMEQ